MLKDPPDVHSVKIPLQVTEDDEIIHPRVAILVILLQNIIFFIAAQLQKEEILQDADVLLVAVVGRTLVFAFLSVDSLHLLLEPQFLH